MSETNRNGFSMSERIGKSRDLDDDMVYIFHNVS